MPWRLALNISRNNKRKLPPRLKHRLKPEPRAMMPNAALMEPNQAPPAMSNAGWILTINMLKICGSVVRGLILIWGLIA